MSHFWFCFFGIGDFLFVSVRVVSWIGSDLQAKETIHEITRTDTK